VLLYSAAAVRANAEGAGPYVAAWIEKGPAAMALYQVLFALFGPYNLAAIGGAWLLLAVTGTVLVGALSAEIGAAGGRIWAAALFAVSLGAVGGTLNTEVPAAVAAAAAVLCWCRSRRSTRPLLAVAAAGVLAGLAFLCRQNAGALWPVLLVGEMARLRWDRDDLRGALRRGGVLTASFAVLPGLTVLGYALAGELNVFLFCFQGYNVDFYIAATKWDALRLLASPVTAARNFLWPVPTLAALGLVGLALSAWRLRASAAPEEEERRPVVLVMALAVAGLTLSLWMGLRFFSHYFALPLPFWAALAGWAVDRVRSGPGVAGRPLVARWGSVGLTVLLLAGLGLELGRRPWRRTTQRLRGWVESREILRPGDPLHWPGRDRLAAQVASFIRNRSSARDRVFVWGMRPHIYAYSRRVPATRFVTCTFLTGLVPWERSAPEEDTARWIVPGSWESLMADLTAEAPLFVVDASADHLFGSGAYSPDRFPQLRDFLSSGYERVLEAGDGDRFVVWRRRP
jgi:hypothetical protein